MHDANFSDAVRPARLVVLRLSLLPYSLGHEALLLNSRSAFITRSPDQFDELPIEQKIFALKTSVLICSQTWAQNNRPHRWLRLWGWLTRNENYPLAIADFQNYLKAGRSLPPAPDKFACELLYGKDEEKGRMSGAPLIAQLYNFAVDNSRKCRCIEPWDASYAFSGTLYFSQLEMEGRARLENSAEADERLNYERIQREVEADEASGKAMPSTMSGGLASMPPDLGD